MASVAGDQRVIIEDVDAAMTGGNPTQFAVDLANQSGLPGLGLTVEHAETSVSRTLERMDNERGLAVLPERADPLLVAMDDAIGGFARVLRREIGELACKIGCDILGADGERNCVRSEPVERAVGVDNVLHVGVEVADVDVEVDTVGESLPRARAGTIGSTVNERRIASLNLVS